ncbi:DNA polymerase III subunit gamma/tau [Winogradskyella aurantiaca]|uniref:DNA polymerase III subunit gamma/tau n=1 Tax=Winogradskyella aurantiaca TaxID=2219558 RepID=UPI000E1E247C|nr:DNA polymerase III subunit gamma/tau [Winogradskyella aurantiaca]
MEHFIVSARKYRPQTFKDVVGQQAITNTLINAIDNNHLAQALLFTGPRGVGKTTCARILAKMINSDDSTAPDEDFAFNIFELDAASNNSVDDIRNLTDQVRIPPQVGKFKVYIIDEVHMLSTAAFNAFLKTLEEPPKHCIFILATTEKHKIIPTILSRCQIFDFKRITVKDAKEYLKYIAENQGVKAEDDALHIIAQKADGAMRDALSIFDRVVSFSGSQLTRQAVTENLNVLDYETFFKSTDLIIDRNIPELLIQFNDVLSKGFDGHHYITGLTAHFRDLLVCKDSSTIPLLEVGEDTKATYQIQAQKISIPLLLEYIRLSNECDLNYKSTKNQRLLVELALMQLASIDVNGEKKNDQRYIIPPQFVNQTPKTIESESIDESPPIVATNELVSTNSIQAPVKDTVVHEVDEPAPVVNIKKPAAAVSGLSLKSIRKKKQHQIKQMDVVIDEDSLPKKPVSQEALVKEWNNYSNKLQDKGERILASIMGMETPVLDESNIKLTYSNSTNKIELEKAQYSLLGYLRKALENYDLNLDISVNEEVATKYAFTPQEKYEKLKEKNPNIELLKKTFGLDV